MRECQDADVIGCGVIVVRCRIEEFEEGVEEVEGVDALVGVYWFVVV